MTLTVVVPTFNEAYNVPLLIDELERILCGIDYEILVVDDDSPDLTWKCVEQISRTRPRVRLLRRTTNRGLTPAVIEGFAHAQSDFLACIDGDLQHDPRLLTSMLEELQRGTDLVIGSRYIKNGGLGEWHWSRRIVSWVAAKLARLSLGTNLSDPMSGYFMLRRSTFLKAHNQLEGSGFKVLLEIVAKARPQHVRELGYIFRPRSAGKSKLSTAVIVSYLAQLWRLSRIGQLVSFRFLQFALVGTVGVIINLLVLATVIWFSGVHDWRASAVATFVATIHNYLLNNHWTFRQTTRKGWGLVSGYLSYAIVCLAGLFITTACYMLFATSAVRISGLAPGAVLPMPIILLTQLFAISTATICNYVLSCRMIWRTITPSTILR